MSDPVVTEPGSRGEPRRLVCREHEGCTWRRDLAGHMTASDPVVRALFAAHLRDRLVPPPPMMGHPKRARA